MLHYFTMQALSCNKTDAFPFKLKLLQLALRLRMLLCVCTCWSRASQHIALVNVIHISARYIFVVGVYLLQQDVSTRNVCVWVRHTLHFGVARPWKFYQVLFGRLIIKFIIQFVLFAEMYKQFTIQVVVLVLSSDEKECNLSRGKACRNVSHNYEHSVG